MNFENPPVKLLIALSKGFGFKQLFFEKAEQIISNLGIDEVDVVQDDLKIVSEYFSAKFIRVNSVPVSTRSASTRRVVEKYTHLLIFWDGDDLTDLVYQSSLARKSVRLIPVQITKVRNKDRDEPYDVYIGRGTPWGNPFQIGLGGTGETREEVLVKYREYFDRDILQDAERHKALLSLRGYRLGCHCKPQACHGDVIAEYLNTLL